jgi:betaine-aldehyde dehydrogenase
MTSTTIDFAIQNFIAGRWAPGSAAERIAVHNPADGGIIATFTSSTPADVGAARTAQPAWAALSARQRSEILRDLARAFKAAGIEEFTRVKAIGIDLGLDD